MFSQSIFSFLSTIDGFLTDRSPSMKKTSEGRSCRKSSNSFLERSSKLKRDLGLSSFLMGSSSCSNSKMYATSASALAYIFIGWSFFSDSSGSSLLIFCGFSASLISSMLMAMAYFYAFFFLFSIFSRFLSLDLKQLLSFFLTQNSISLIFLGLSCMRSKERPFVVISWKGFSSIISMTPTYSFQGSDFMSSAIQRISFSSQFFSFLFFLRQQQFPDSLISEISLVTLSMLFWMLFRLFQNSNFLACSTWKRNQSTSSLIMLRVCSSQVNSLRCLKTNMILSLKESIVWMFFLFSAQIYRKEFIKPILCRYWARAGYRQWRLNRCRMFFIFSACLLFPSGSWLKRRPALSTPTSLLPRSLTGYWVGTMGCAKNCLFKSSEAILGSLLVGTYSISPRNEAFLGTSVNLTSAKPLGRRLLMLLRCSSVRMNWFALPRRWQIYDSSQNITYSLIIGQQLLQ